MQQTTPAPVQLRPVVLGGTRGTTYVHGRLVPAGHELFERRPDGRYRRIGDLWRTAGRRGLNLTAWR